MNHNDPYLALAYSPAPAPKKTMDSYKAPFYHAAGSVATWASKEAIERDSLGWFREYINPPYWWQTEKKKIKEGGGNEGVAKLSQETTGSREQLKTSRAVQEEAKTHPLDEDAGNDKESSTNLSPLSEKSLKTSRVAREGTETHILYEDASDDREASTNISLLSEKSLKSTEVTQLIKAFTEDVKTQQAPLERITTNSIITSESAFPREALPPTITRVVSKNKPKTITIMRTEQATITVTQQVTSTPYHRPLNRIPVVSNRVAFYGLPLLLLAVVAWTFWHFWNRNETRARATRAAPGYNNDTKAPSSDRRRRAGPTSSPQPTSTDTTALLEQIIAAGKTQLSIILQRRPGGYTGDMSDATPHEEVEATLRGLFDVLLPTSTSSSPVPERPSTTRAMFGLVLESAYRAQQAYSTSMEKGLEWKQVQIDAALRALRDNDTAGRAREKEMLRGNAGHRLFHSEQGDSNIHRSRDDELANGSLWSVSSSSSRRATSEQPTSSSPSTSSEGTLRHHLSATSTSDVGAGTESTENAPSVAPGSDAVSLEKSPTQTAQYQYKDGPESLPASAQSTDPDVPSVAGPITQKPVHSGVAAEDRVVTPESASVSHEGGVEGTTPTIDVGSAEVIVPVLIPSFPEETRSTQVPRPKPNVPAQKIQIVTPRTKAANSAGAPASTSKATAENPDQELKQAEDQAGQASARKSKKRPRKSDNRSQISTASSNPPTQSSSKLPADWEEPKAESPAKQASALQKESTPEPSEDKDEKPVTDSKQTPQVSETSEDKGYKRDIFRRQNDVARAKYASSSDEAEG